MCTPGLRTGLDASATCVIAYVYPRQFIGALSGNAQDHVDTRHTHEDAMGLYHIVTDMETPFQDVSVGQEDQTLTRYEINN